MKLSKSLNIFLLVFGFIFFLTGMFFYVTFKNEKNDNREYLKQTKVLESKISTFGSNCLLDQDLLINTNKNQWFDNSYKTPFIVYKNEAPMFWSRSNLFSLYQVNFETIPFGTVDFPNGVYFYIASKFKTNNIEYTLVHFLLIKNKLPFENEFLKVQYNDLLFSSNSVVEVYFNEIKNSFSISYKSKPIFWVKIISISSTYKFAIILFSLSMLFWLGNVLFYTDFLSRIHAKGFSFFILTLYLVSLRMFFYINDGLHFILPKELFESELFVSSFFSNTFADLFLDSILFFIWFVFVYRTFFSSKNLHWLSKLSDEFLFVFIVFITLLSFFFIDFFIVILTDIYQNSSLNFDITRSIQLDLIEAVYLLIFVFLSVIYLLLVRFCLKSSLLFISNQYVYYLILFLSALIYSLLEYYSSSINTLALCLNLIYIIVCWKFSLFQKLKKFRFNSYLYLILTALICSFIGANSIYLHSKELDVSHQIQYAEELLVHDDFQAELLLKRLSDKLKFDFNEQEYLGDTSLTYSQISDDIRNNYMDHYFDNYQIKVFLFDSIGSSLVSTDGDYKYYLEKYKKVNFNTEYSSVYFVNFYDHSDYSRYYCFIDLENYKGHIKSIIVELIAEGLNPNSVYPKLIKAKEIHIPEKILDYQCAVFENENLIFSKGQYHFNYKDFNSVIHSSNDYFIVYNSDGYRHLIYKGIDGKVAVVSLETNSFHCLLTNTSFLLLILLFLFLFFLFVYVAFYNWIQIYPHYSTRIHLYLNFVYLLAILSVSVVTLKWVIKEYDYELKSSFQKNAFHVGKNVTRYLEDYQAGKLELKEFKNSINSISNFSATDLNLYDTTGNLIYTSQPLIFKNGLVTKLLSPIVMKELIYFKHNFFSVDESIGDFKYHNVYLSLTSYNDDRKLAIMSMPFLDSQDELESRKVALVNVILNVFTVVFILVLVISYASFVNITSPLKKLSASLSTTSLDNNVKIDWKADDEIGMLVRAYNNMIAKLEINKIQLSERQKEDAWKEMAKQVAHEIKNPLTPMQLKLQHIKRLFTDNEQVQLSIDSVLEQVHTLSEIATSFSNFAKMPAPEYERLDITRLLSEACMFFENESVDIIQNINSKNIFVVADKKLLSRVFNNLIINAIQSVHSNYKPLVILTLEEFSHHILITIQDNGDGIPDEIKEKVFQPNFSTKFNGSGIGLAIAKRGIEHGGGKIWFESEEGKGTTFMIEIPIAS